MYVATLDRSFDCTDDSKTIQLRVNVAVKRSRLVLPKIRQTHERPAVKSETTLRRRSSARALALGWPLSLCDPVSLAAALALHRSCSICLAIQEGFGGCPRVGLKLFSSVAVLFKCFVVLQRF